MTTTSHTRVIKYGTGYALTQRAKDGKYKLRAFAQTRAGIERARAVASKYFPDFTVKA